MKHFVVIVAGGKGLRMGGALPKQFVPIEGKPVLMHTVETFYRWNSEATLVLVLPKEHHSYWNMLCREIGFEVSHSVVEGGNTRYASVSNGLRFIANKIKNESIEENIVVGIHDGVRPFVSSEVIERCFSAAQEFGAAVPVVPVTDSLREKDAEGSHAVERAAFMVVQTPQVFKWSVLKDSYSLPYQESFTDDASVVEASGFKVKTVNGNPENIKLTTPIDLIVAENLLGRNIK